MVNVFICSLTVLHTKSMRSFVFHDPVIYTRNREQNNIRPSRRSFHTVYKSPVHADRHKIDLNLEEFQLFNSHNKIKNSITSTIFSTNESECARFMRSGRKYVFASCTCILLIFFLKLYDDACLCCKKMKLSDSCIKI